MRARIARGSSRDQLNRTCGPADRELPTGSLLPPCTGTARRRPHPDPAKSSEYRCDRDQEPGAARRVTRGAVFRPRAWLGLETLKTPVMNFPRRSARSSSRVLRRNCTNLCDRELDQQHHYRGCARHTHPMTPLVPAFQQLRFSWQRAEADFLSATAETVALYLSSQVARFRPSTLEHHLSAIAKAHEPRAISPTEDSILIAETLNGIRPTHGTAHEQKSHILTEDLPHVASTAT